MKAYNETKNIYLGKFIIEADSFFKRLKGLIGIKKWDNFDGLFIKPCHGIHTLFMRITIDVIFFNKDGMIIFEDTIKPNNLGLWIEQCESVLELPEGKIKETNCQIGDRIIIH